MVPCLALDCREPHELAELVGCRHDQRELTLLRQHQQQVLVGQQDELAAAVASALLLAIAVLDIDTREHAAVDAEGMAIMKDEVAEVGLQPGQRPARMVQKPDLSPTNRKSATYGKPLPAHLERSVLVSARR